MFWCGVAGRVGVVGEQRLQLLLAEPAAIDDAEIVEQHAFLVDGGGERRHRAGRGAADIGMMAARGDVEEDFLPLGEVPPRRRRGLVRRHRRTSSTAAATPPGRFAATLLRGGNTGVTTVMSGRCVPPL